MDANRPDTYLFWEAFETDAAKAALANKGRITVDQIRHDLGSALIKTPRPTRRAIKQAVANGRLQVRINRDGKVEMKTHEMTLRHETTPYRLITAEYQILSDGVLATVTKCNHDPSSWTIEEAYAQYIATLQKQGKLKYLAEPLSIDRKTRTFIYRQCQLKGKLAPTLSTLSDDPNLKAKIKAWCQVGKILIDLHDNGLIHGDFCDQQVCLTDDGPMLVDFESMWDGTHDLLIEFDRDGGGLPSQEVYGNLHYRILRTDRYHNWTMIAQSHLPSGWGSTRISATYARRIEACAFAINMLEHLYGENINYHPDRLQIDTMKNRHASYFAKYPGQETAIRKTVLEISNALVHLLSLHPNYRHNFAEVVQQLQALCAQLPD